MHMRLSMDMRTFSPEFHVAQQGRREKLRIQQDSNPLSRCVPNSDPIPGDNIISYSDNPSGICPETTTSNLYSTTTNPPVPPCFSTWKSIGTERSSWVPANRTPISVGEDKNCTNPANTTASTVYQKALSLSLSSDTSSKFSAGNGVVTQSLTHRYPGPLGPFTGYASILRSSKFLRPAQQILEDLCFVARSRLEQACGSRDQILEEVRVCGGDYGDAADGIGSDSSGSSSHVANGRSDRRREIGGAAAAGYCRPENVQTKAKLLYMQDEASKRYKQYQQQMQMVVSSFESVAGLNTATPYVSVAIKTVGKHFRCLKDSIADHLKSLRNALGEDLPAPSASSKAESVFKFFENGFPMPKGTHSSNILDGQHIWRPQRGLPERAVSILRAWLFDHFLHPYPTDTDKHMLASQTGLTRNQVSNWFINARVRLWKPMVEEIHMLETKGLAGETGPNNACKAAATTSTSAAISYSRQAFNRTSIISSGQDKQVEQQSTVIGLLDQHGPNADGWNPDKRSRIEYHHDPTAVVGRSLMGYGGGRFEMAGPGAVSLTLGLRQSAENGHLAPPLLAGNHHNLRQHFGGQLIRDFVG